jgi:AraC-like DNA-binding protein
MASNGAGAPSFRFSTEDFPERGRAAAWREFFGREIAGLDIEPLPRRAYQADATVTLFPDLVVLSGRCSGAHYHVLRELIRNDDIAFITTASESWQATQLGREVTLGKWDAVATTNGEPGSTTHHVVAERAGRASPFICLSIPRRALVGLVANLDDALLRSIPARTEALRLLMGYLQVVGDPAAVGAPELARLAAIHVHDLVAMAIGATRDAAEIARGRGVRAARLRAIEADIAANIERGDVSATALALRHRVSPRYIHKLFEGEGTTLSRFVLNGRLQRVYRRLSDPRSVPGTIGAIAFDAGFSDLSTFNHAFRRQFGATPSEVRAEAVARWKHD